MAIVMFGAASAMAQTPTPPGTPPATPADPHAAHAAVTEAQPHDDHAAAPDGRWRFGVDGVAFLGYNYQRRAFTDFDQVESQNWVMVAAERRERTSSVAFVSMFSLEPFTMRDLGSPQVFQTGETFGGAPLIDYQHPHDLVMALGGRVERTLGRVRGAVAASLVGSPALGPPPFMHRASAADNPQVPLSHHGLDSTHISSEVLTGGVTWRALTLEGSWFHGREPDENRLDLDFGAPDSWAARLAWASGPWRAQASGGRLEQPETIHPYDETRLSASVGYEGAWRRWPVAALLAWGQKREPFGIFDSYLFEAHATLGARDALFTRAELVTKAILGGGVHPPGFQHYHPHSRIGAITVGYVRDVMVRSSGRLGVGADFTAYRVPANLAENYGRPLSFHLFLRYVAPRSATPVHH
jgi:hypothetical protein